jgi:hypothetical protein
MSDTKVSCPVCCSRDGHNCIRRVVSGDGYVFDCEACGEFRMTSTALVVLEASELPMNDLRRASLAYRIQQSIVYSSSKPSLDSDDVSAAINSKRTLPNPNEQATNIIRLIGDHVQLTGDDLAEVPTTFAAAVGSPSRNAALRIASELVNRGVITGYNSSHFDSPYQVQNLNLTLDGWRIYDEEKRGRTAGTFGFLAMKFGDDILDPFSREVIKPAIQSIGFELIDIRDTARAGIIDNLLRAQIRDAAFVLVDLTHDNSGAYWEAGFAEGLGKPVLYLCEKAKFDERKTHFDTNHCTTVIWQRENPKIFTDELVATLRRSLNLF